MRSFGVALLSVMLLATTACNQYNQGAAPGRGVQVNEYNRTTPDRTTRVLVGSDLNPNLVPGATDARNIQVEADRMANVAVQVPKVKRASVVTNGARAYVGLTLADTVRSDREAAAIKEKVRLLIQQKMPRYEVRVSSDHSIFTRIQDIGDGIRHGTPVNNYRLHIGDLDKRMK
jgi:YhcN/YlaJ family sporulation lipoprotein